MKALYTLLLLFCIVSLSACAKQVTYNEALTGDAPIGDTIAAREANARQFAKPDLGTPSKGIIVNQSNQDVLVKLDGPERRSIYLQPKRSELLELLTGNYRIQIWRGSRLIRDSMTGIGREKFVHNGETHPWGVVIFP